MIFTTEMNQPKWQQGSLVEVEITDLSDRADGVARWNNRVVFVPDTVKNRKHGGHHITIEDKIASLLNVTTMENE